MKLYEIPRKSKIFGEISDGSTYLIFNTLDGMYSHCTTEKGGVLHLSVMQELKEVEGGYEIEKKKPTFID